jgi:hypothetical protein
MIAPTAVERETSYIGVTKEEAWAIIVKVALDGMPTVRRVVFGLLVESTEPLRLSQIAERVEWVSTTTVRRALK